MQKPDSVLVIDDNFTDFYIIKRLFKNLNMCNTFYHKDNGEDSLTFLKNFISEYTENKQVYGENYPHLLVLLDINMPNMDGFEFLEHFSDLNFDKDSEILKIIMYSTSELEQDKNRALKNDYILDYVVKPLTPNNISGLIDQHYN